MAFMILKGGILRRIEKYMADFPEDFFLSFASGWSMEDRHKWHRYSLSFFLRHSHQDTTFKKN